MFIGGTEITKIYACVYIHIYMQIHAYVYMPLNEFFMEFFLLSWSSPITELLDEDENICSECGCDKFSSRSKAETLKVDSPAKQM